MAAAFAIVVESVRDGLMAREIGLMVAKSIKK
jgi:hypothetical protein